MGGLKKDARHKAFLQRSGRLTGSSTHIWKVKEKPQCLDGSWPTIRAYIIQINMYRASLPLEENLEDVVCKTSNESFMFFPLW